MKIRAIERAIALVRECLARMPRGHGRASSSESAVKEDDAYTLFESGALGLHNLSVHQLEKLATDPGLLPGSFRIRIARPGDPPRRAGILVERRYNSRGYRVKSPGTDPFLSTVVAYNAGELVGTVSLRLDSAKGLAADQLYKAEIDALRQPGSMICEFTRLAIDINAGSKP